MRYITGKPRINRRAINSTSNANNLANNAATNTPAQPLDENATEEDRIKLMFQNQSNAWEQTQEDLSHHKMVFINQQLQVQMLNKMIILLQGIFVIGVVKGSLD